MARGRIILGVLAGLSAGAILGILFAPDKGSATRKVIAKKGEDYFDNLKHRINERLSNNGKKHEKVLENVSSAL